MQHHARYSRRVLRLRVCLPDIHMSTHFSRIRELRGGRILRSPDVGEHVVDLRADEQRDVR